MKKMAVKSYQDSTTTTKTDSAGEGSSSSSPSSGYDDSEQKKREAEAAEAARRAKIQAQIDANNLEIARLNKKIQEYKTMLGQISVAQASLAEAGDKPVQADNNLKSNYYGSQLASLQSTLRRVYSGNNYFNKLSFTST